MSTSTIPFPEDGDVSWRMDPSRLSVVKAVTRRMVPYLVEATLLPTALFYVFFITFGLRWAIVAAVGWTYAAVGRRIVSGRPIPGLLVLAVVGISVRTVVYLFNSNNFVYFFQPILRTVATAAFFALSVVVGRPLVARLPPISACSARKSKTGQRWRGCSAGSPTCGRRSTVSSLRRA